MHTFLTEVRETLAPDQSDRVRPPATAARRHDGGHGTRRLVQLPAARSCLRRQHDGQRRLPRLRVAGAQGFSIGASLVALVAFGLGSVLGGRIVARFGHHRGHHLAVATGAQALLLAVVDDPRLRRLAPLRLRRPLRAHRRPQPGHGRAELERPPAGRPDLTTTVLTLTVTGIGADSALGGGKGSKSGRRLISVAAMFVGALVGAALVLHVHVALPLVIALVIVVVVAAVSHLAGRSNPPWTRVED